MRRNFFHSVQVLESKIAFQPFLGAFQRSFRKISRENINYKISRETKLITTAGGCNFETVS